MALSVTIQRSPLVAERANQHPPTSTLQTLSCGFSSCLQGFPSIQEFYLPCAIFLSIFLQNFICPEFYLALHDFSAHFFPLSIWVPYFIWSFFPIAERFGFEGKTLYIFITDIRPKGHRILWPFMSFCSDLHTIPLSLRSYGTIVTLARNDDRILDDSKRLKKCLYTRLYCVSLQ
jgi:hypothetical protein